MLEVNYQLLIDGAPADAELMELIQEVEIEDHARLAGIMRLRLALSTDASGLSWSPLDDGTFARLTRLGVIVEIGSTVREPVIDAYVIKLDVKLSDQPGSSTLEVVAMDATTLMSLEDKVRAWVDMSDSNIAETVFGEYGFTTDVEPTTITHAQAEETTLQRGTDIEFLRMLARRNGYECYVEVDPVSRRSVGHFHAPRLSATAQPVLSVNLGDATNVTQFSVTHDLLRPAQVRAHSLHVGRGSGEAVDIAQPSATPLGSSVQAPGDRPRRVRVPATGFSETAELQSVAQAIVDARAQSIRAQGELMTVVYGNILRAKRPVDVRGLGQQLCGTYYVDSVTHHIVGGDYKQRFVLVRNALGLSGREDFSSQDRMVS